MKRPPRSAARPRPATGELRRPRLTRHLVVQVPEDVPSQAEARLHGFLRKLPHHHPLPKYYGHPIANARIVASGKPTAVREGGGGLRASARTPRRGARALGPALRRRALGGVLP